jgi:hypothetical protein
MLMSITVSVLQFNLDIARFNRMMLEDKLNQMMLLLKKLTALVTFVFVMILILGLAIPIYADEVSTKMTQANVFNNGGMLLTALPQCFPEMTMDIPVTWMPGAAIYQIVYANLSPLMIRISGIVIALLWVFSVIVIYKKIALSKISSSCMIIITLSIIGLGVLPLTLVLSRSEQLLLILLSYFIYLIFTSPNKKLIQLFSRVFVFFIATSLFYYIHGKSVFFSPVVILSAWIGFRGSRFLQILLVLFVLSIALQTIIAGRDLFKCEDAPIIAAGFASQTIKMSILIDNPSVFFRLLYIYLDSAPDKIINHIIFKPTYQSNWLPSINYYGEQQYLKQVINIFITIVIKGIMLLSFIVPLISISVAFFRRQLGLRHILVFTLLISLLAHLSIYTNWNFYGGILVIAVCVLIICISFSEIKLTKLLLLFISPLIALLCITFLISSFILFYTYAQPLLNTIDEKQQFGVSGQPISVPTFSYFKQREKIRNFAQYCGVNGDGAHRLVVDDLTYFSFKELHEPMHISYISDKGMGQDIKGSNLEQFLREKGSVGIISQCAILPDEILESALSSGRLCCLKF